LTVVIHRLPHSPSLIPFRLSCKLARFDVLDTKVLTRLPHLLKFIKSVRGTFETTSLKGRASQNVYPVSRLYYRGAGKSSVRPRRKQATATEDFDFHISYL
jgi:hypothetical protein